MERPRSSPRSFPPILPCTLAWLAGLTAALPQGPPPLSLDEIGGGEMLWRAPHGLVPLPVLDLDVEVEVTGVLAHGIVSQRFHNPTDGVLEAVYVFPLPDRAAVQRMEMRIGERRIVSVLREREQARRDYEAARDEGRKAALVEQHRPNLFTTEVANLNPRETVEVRLDYLQEIDIDDGRLSLALPLTYVPRFEAGGPPLPADAAGPGTGAPERAALPTARVVARVRPGFPLDGGDVRSPSHDVATRWDGDALVVETRRPRVPADRDFRLEWRPLPGTEPRAAAFVEDREDGRYLLLMALPPPAGEAPGLPVETLFVVDMSGSMEGQSIARAREAIVAALGRLGPGDAFNILTFAEDLVPYADGFLPAGEPEVVEAQAWVRRLGIRGGTRIDLALARAIAMTAGPDEERLRRIVFLTDGGVNDEDEILRMLRRGLGPVRLHALGIGAAPNRYLLREMGRLGRGLCGFIADAGTTANEIDAFLARLDRPVLTGLEVGWEGGPPALELFPDPLPDLHAGEPLLASLRAPSGASLARLTLRGHAGGSPVAVEVDAAAAAAASGVAVRWGRARVDALLDLLREGEDADAVRAEVVATALRFGIVTPYTSLVAVEEFPTAAGEAERLRVASALPAGMLPRGGGDGARRARLGAVLVVAGGALLLLGTVPGRRAAPGPVPAAGKPARRASDPRARR
jgi:Ca-activated chloride channel family protein